MDARWRTIRPERPGYLSYQENIVVDRGGFIRSRAIAQSSEAEWEALPPKPEEESIKPESLAVNTGYSAGRLRQNLEELGIKAYIALHPNQSSGREDRIGSLAAGHQADISVLGMVESDWVVYDVLGDSRRTERAVAPVLTVKRGEVYEAGWGQGPGAGNRIGFRQTCMGMASKGGGYCARPFFC